MSLNDADLYKTKWDDRVKFLDWRIRKHLMMEARDRNTTVEIDLKSDLGNMLAFKDFDELTELLALFENPGDRNEALTEYFDRFFGVRSDSESYRESELRLAA